MTNQQSYGDSLTIIGVDPGSRIAGYGVINHASSSMHYVASGCIRSKGETYLARIKQIYLGMEEIINHYQPDVVILEKVFMARNPDTALKLGQVRGLIISILLRLEIPLFEYAAREVKKNITGSGSAAKQQVQYMVQRLLNLSKQPADDAADALALAICYIYHGAPKP